MLTVRTNGSTTIVSASWWNDYHDLLTGVMSDQEVTINNNLALVGLGVAPSSGPGGSAVSGGSLGIGIFGYCYTYVSADGESPPSPAPGITTTSGNQQIQLNSISTGPTGTIARNIYRTKVGGGYNYQFNVQLADNTTTSYLDNNADSTLGASVSNKNSFGGSLIIKNSSGVVTGSWSNDGFIKAQGISFPTSGSIANACLVSGVGNGATQNYNHSLGATPHWASVTNVGSYANPQPYAPTYVGGNSTQIQVNAQSGITFWAVLWRNVT